MKKFLFLVPFLALLAAGCNSGTVRGTGARDNNQTTPQSQTQIAPAQNQTDKASPPAAAQMPDTWTGTLKNSDNQNKGNLMLVAASHTIYINTSRDYSSLVGQKG